MSFETIKHLLSKNEAKDRTDVALPPVSLTEEPDKIRVNRNKFARLSSRIKAA